MVHKTSAAWEELGMAKVPSLWAPGPNIQGLQEPGLAWPRAESCTLERRQGLLLPTSQKSRAFLEIRLPGRLVCWAQLPRGLPVQSLTLQSK